MPSADRSELDTTPLRFVGSQHARVRRPSSQSRRAGRDRASPAVARWSRARPTADRRAGRGPNHFSWSVDPTATTTSSVASVAERPRNWIRWRPWSLQKNGTGAYIASSAPFAVASRLRAATAPCSAALVQCSTRISSPNRRFGHRHTSPAAHTPGRGGQRVVADDAVAQRQPAALQPPGRRRHPDADHDHVGRHQLAAGQPSRRRHPSPRRGRRSGCRCRRRRAPPWRPGPSRRRGPGSAATGGLRARSPRSPGPAPWPPPRGR